MEGVQPGHFIKLIYLNYTVEDGGARPILYNAQKWQIWIHYSKQKNQKMYNKAGPVTHITKAYKMAKLDPLLKQKMPMNPNADANVGEQKQYFMHLLRDTLVEHHCLTHWHGTITPFLYRQSYLKLVWDTLAWNFVGLSCVTAL